MFLIVVFAIAGLAPLVLLALVGVITTAIERVREGRRHAHVLAELGTPVSAENAFGAARHEVVTIEGKLVALGSEPRAGHLASFHPYGTSFLDEVNAYAVSCSTAAQGFAVDLDAGGGRALLDGPTQVLRGALETEHTASLDRAASLGAAPLAQSKVKKRVGQFRVVEAGDRVRVRGAVEPAPDDDALYRARSNVLRMTPGPASTGQPTIVVAAISSRRRRTTRRVAVPVIALVLGGACASYATHVARLEEPPPAMPLHASAVEPTCRAPALAKLAQYGDPPSCDDAYTRAMTYYAAGQFIAASAAFVEAVEKNPELPPTLSEVETHLFVHAYDRAASTVRRMDAQFYPGPSTPEKRHLECILDILDAHSGMVEAGAGPPHFVKVCSTTPFAKVARVLDSNGQYLGEDDWPRPTFFHDARYDAVGETFTSVVATRSRLLARPVALERDLVDRMGVGGKVERYFPVYADELEPLLATYAAELALFYAFAGFPERAAPYWPYLDIVAGMVESGHTFYKPSAKNELQKQTVQDETNLLVITLGVAAAAALYADDPGRLQRYSAVGEPYTSQAARQMYRLVRPGATWEDPVVDRTWPESQAVFAAGTPANVVKVLTENHSTGRTTLARELPHLGSADRTPLVQWFRSDAYPAACLTCGASSYLGDLSDRREVARLLGETSESDRLKRSAERFTTALTDPQLGFELDELETFFSKRK